MRHPGNWSKTPILPLEEKNAGWKIGHNFKALWMQNNIGPEKEFDESLFFFKYLPANFQTIDKS